MLLGPRFARLFSFPLGKLVLVAQPVCEAHVFIELPHLAVRRLPLLFQRLLQLAVGRVVPKLIQEALPLRATKTQKRVHGFDRRDRPINRVN